jgi:hypothetical protein
MDGHVDEVKKMLAEGTSVNLLSGDQNTPLHVAATVSPVGPRLQPVCSHIVCEVYCYPTRLQSGHLPVVEALLDAGADIDALHEELDLAPLHMAANWGWPHVVNKLVERKANVNARTAEHGITVSLPVLHLIYSCTGLRQTAGQGTAPHDVGCRPRRPGGARARPRGAE